MFFHSIFDVGRSMFDVHLLIGSMFIFSRSMTRGVFAFKYEAEKNRGGLKVWELGITSQKPDKKSCPPGSPGGLILKLKWFERLDFLATPGANNLFFLNFLIGHGVGYASLCRYHFLHIKTLSANNIFIDYSSCKNL
jgi:hypothetical protein